MSCGKKVLWLPSRLKGQCHKGHPVWQHASLRKLFGLNNLRGKPKQPVWNSTIFCIRAHRANFCIFGCFMKGNE